MPGAVTDDARHAPAGQAVRVRLLGPFAVSWDGRSASPWPRPSARRLCELVLVSPGRRVSRELACEELFPGLEPRAAARALSKALSMARSALAELGEPAASLLAADLSHIWASGAADVDADAHRQELRDALAMDPGDERDGRLARVLAEDGELLADEPYADWALGPRERLDALRQEARLALARDRAKGAGRPGPDDVIAAWQSCLEHDPACEEAAGALVRAYFATGRPELAARAYERCRAALLELGLRISPSLQKVYAAAAPVPAPAQPTAPAAPTASQAGQAPLREELRTVSMLFAEAAAPSRPVGAGGLETLRELVGGCIAAVITEVEALGGTVTSVSGRGLQAMFGAPTAHEDDPERAARAAFRALSAGAASADGTTLALRIGVETGPALVGPIGGGAKIEYAAVGDVVNAAAALQSSARPGTALIGPATRAVIDHLFTWGGSEEVGSSAGPMTASYLDAPRARAAGRHRRLGGSAPLVGRQAEMAELGRALRDAVNGRGSVVVLTGEPGLGKTRLVHECRKLFMAWVGARSGRLPLWLEGRCASYASATPYGLYQQLVAGWVGVAPDQPDELLRPALERALTGLMGNANLLAPLGRMMGMPGGAGPDRLSAEELRRATFGAVRSLLVRLAAVGPTVIALEDLHWADPTSLRLTGEIAALPTGRPLLVLATTRPGADNEVADSWRRPAGAAQQARRVLLRPLPEDATEALAVSLMGDAASRDVLGAVLGGVGGNPLFLEERLFSLLETGALVREQGTWRLRGTPVSSLPQVLDRLVRSRIDRLSPAAQEAVRVASVLGTEFPRSLLAAVLPDGGALEPVIDELCASDLLHEMPGSGEPAFRFRHALIQEATYLGLVRAERRGLHGRAARAIEAAAGRLEEAAAVIGRHFAAAQDPERAAFYLEMAGDHATDAFANDEAVSSFQAAVALAPRQSGASLPAGATTARLHAKLANVLWRTGRWQEAGEAFRAALRVADHADTPLMAHLYTRLGRLEMTENRYDAAAEAFTAAGALLTAHPLEMDDATADQWLELMVDGWASLHSRRYEPDRALAALDAARPVLAARGTPAREFAFYSTLTFQRLIRNRFGADETDIETRRKGLEAARRTGEEKDVGYATYFLGWTFWLRGDLAQAQQHLERALAMAERIGETLLLRNSLLFLALTALRRHDVLAVRSLLRRAIAAAELIGSLDYVADTKPCQAWLAWQDRRPDDVIRLASEYEQTGPGTADSCARYRWVYLWPLIAARLAVGATAEAVAAGRRILGPTQQALPGELTAVLEAGCQAWDRGEPGLAVGQLSAALALAHQLHYF